MSGAIERLESLARRLRSLQSSTDGLHEEVARAAQDRERVAEFSARVDGLAVDAADAGDDAELVGLLDDEVDALAAEVEQFISDSPIAKRFFRSKPKSPDPVPAEEFDPDAYRTKKVVWRLGNVDLNHPQEWLRVEDGQALVDVLGRLRDYENMTWNEVAAVSKHNHAWEDWTQWQPASRDRLQELELQDQAGWYQLHLDKRGRLIGFRTDVVFNILWWDRAHEVYKTKPR